MSTTTDRLEFAPPPPPGMVRALVLAVIAHLLLMLALTWGVNWKREAENISAEAELWSSVPQQAAPRAVEPPPPPAPPRPVVKAAPAPKPEPAPRQADIALEQEKKRQALASKAAEEKQKLEAAARARQQDDAKRQEAQRAENLRRMLGQAGATGAPTSTAAAMHSSSPSAGWQGRVRARVKPNIVFTEDVAGNPVAEVEVRTSPDGTIVGQPRLIKSSGVRSWDEAVIKALIKTEVLPRDVDGRVYTPVILAFRPKDF